MKKSEYSDFATGRLTKKYLVDLLNTLCFSNTIHWDGDDQYNQLPILRCDEEDKTTRHEQRGALLVHKSLPHALLFLVTAYTGSKQQICYRLVGIQSPLEIEDPEKTCYPMKSAKLDFSLADTDLGIERDSSYCFSDNTSEDKEVSKSRLFKLLKFILESSLVILDDKEIFEDYLLDILSQPPVAGDPHFVPIFQVYRD